jgi:hypothetical protein
MTLCKMTPMDLLCTCGRSREHFVIAHVILCDPHCFLDPWPTKGEGNIFTR